MKFASRFGQSALVFALAAGFSPALLADDNEASKTEDTTKNPITGTETNTKVEESKTTDANGTVTKVKKKKVAKVKKDGSKKSTTEKSTSTETK